MSIYKLFKIQTFSGRKTAEDLGRAMKEKFVDKLSGSSTSADTGDGPQGKSS